MKINEMQRLILMTLVAFSPQVNLLVKPEDQLPLVNIRLLVTSATLVVTIN